MTHGRQLVPGADLEEIRRYCAGRVPPRVAHLVRLDVEVDGRTLTIVECRPPWSPAVGAEWSRLVVARLRFVESHRKWTLYWSDRHQRIHRYALLPPNRDVSVLLAEIGRVPWSGVN